MNNNTFRLLIKEAMFIKFKNSSLNRKDAGSTRILKLYADGCQSEIDNVRCVCGSSVLCLL